MSRTNPDRAKDPQFAAILSSILPGLGHFYNNRPIVGFTWLIVIWGLASAALWAAIAPGIPLIVGIGLFFGSWILAIVQSCHIHRSIWQANNPTSEADLQAVQDPWLTAFQSWIKGELNNVSRNGWGIWPIYFISSLILRHEGIIAFLSYAWCGGFMIVYRIYGLIIVDRIHSGAVASYTTVQRNRRFWLATLAPLIGGALLAISMYIFVVETDFMTGDSMLPALREDDKIIINKLTYHFTPPKRGDLISINQTKDPELRGVNRINRIIGMPGETIEVKDGKVFINGKALSENYVTKAPAYDYDYAYSSTQVPAGEYFVLSDNDPYGHSDGFVSRARIVGQATKRFGPIDWIETLK
jgi:signal peptidase I